MVRRFLPDVPLPAYTYVPGHRPHPFKDAAGHSYASPRSEPDPLDPEAWQDSRAFVWGVDLFNHGYYWEAHESWEGLWHAAGRTGPLAELLRGLIKLAAAGVKLRQGSTTAARTHATGARRHFDELMPLQRLAGLSLPDLAAVCVEACSSPAGDPGLAVEVVFERRLLPE